MATINPFSFNNVYAASGAATSRIPPQYINFGQDSKWTTNTFAVDGGNKTGQTSGPKNEFESHPIVDSMQKIDNAVLKPVCKNDVLGQNIDFYS